MSTPAPSAPDEQTPVIFVSYTTADRKWAEWIAWQLKRAGHRIVIQAWDFPAGSNFVVEMDKATAAVDRTVAVLSAEYLESEFGRSEWAAAFAADPTGERGKLLPVRVADVVPAGLLRQIVWVDLFDCDEQTAKARLLAAVNHRGRRPSASPAFPGEADYLEGAATARPVFPSPLPPIWNVPARNRLFTGRDEWLARLAAELTTDRHTVLTQAVSGLGGIGKSQLAIEYAYRYASSYRLVWWVRAETVDACRTDLLALARRLALPGIESMSADAQLASLGEWLERNRDWLVIFDNVETPDDLHDLLPRAGVGHVLITSRYSAWAGIARTLRLDLWTPEESRQFLQKRTGQEDEPSALELAETLGYLPLAIEQAAAYVDEARITLAEFTKLFRECRGPLLKAASSKTTIATVWNLSFQSVRRQSAAAVSLLHLAAFLPPDGFPREKLRRPVGRLPGSLTDVLANDLALNDAIAVLRRYSLIEATPQQVSVHRLVQAVVQESLSPDDRGAFAMASHRIQHGMSEHDAEEPVAEERAPAAPGRWRKAALAAATVALLVSGAFIVNSMMTENVEPGGPVATPPRGEDPADKLLEPGVLRVTVDSATVSAGRGGMLSVQAVDVGTDRPLGGAEVNVRELHLRGFTDGNGRVRFQLPPSVNPGDSLTIEVLKIRYFPSPMVIKAVITGQDSRSSRTVGDRAVGVVVREDASGLYLDISPCNSKLKAFQKPYDKTVKGTVTCNGKTLSTYEVTQR